MTEANPNIWIILGSEEEYFGIYSSKERAEQAHEQMGLSDFEKVVEQRLDGWWKSPEQIQEKLEEDRKKEFAEKVAKRKKDLEIIVELASKYPDVTVTYKEGAIDFSR